MKIKSGAQELCSLYNLRDAGRKVKIAQINMDTNMLKVNKG